MPANKSSKPRKAKARGVYNLDHVAERSSKRKYVPTFIMLQLDTASDITVISKQVWNYSGNPPINRPTIQATDASGKPLHLMVEFQCDVCSKGKTAPGRCFLTLVGID